MRSELGTLLTRAGLLSDAQIAAVEGTARSEPIHFVDALTRSALITEDGLADFVHRKLLIPKVSPNVLARVSEEVARQIDNTLAWGRLVLPVSIDHRNNLTLAMADPTDSDAVRRVTAATGRFVVRAAAPLRPLRSAISRCLGGESEPTPRRMDAIESVARAELDPEPTAVVTPLHASGGDPVPSRTTPNESNAATSVSDDDIAPADVLGRLLPRLAEVTDSSQLVALALDFLELGFGRTLVLVHAHGELRVLAARGEPQLEEDTKALKLVVQPPSIFASVLTGTRPYFGALPQREDAERSFAAAVGGISGNMLLLPIAAADKVPLLLFAHPATKPVDPTTIDQLMRAMSSALRRLLAASDDPPTD